MSTTPVSESTWSFPTRRMVAPTHSVAYLAPAPVAARRSSPAGSRRAGRSFQDSACRVLNVAVAGVAVVLLAPVLALIAVLVKLSSPGPAIYKQPRVGIDRRGSRGPESVNGRRSENRGGRIFTIYKFRTMRQEAQPDIQVWASKEDPRITRIGKVLRASRLDELPQFFNVIKGDMNIVGPRPEQPRIFQELSNELRNYRDRQRVLPGITGLAQVSQGYDQSLEDVKRKVDLDLEYIRRRSAVEDLMIMAKTMPVMVFRRGGM
ncbi:MAG: sugar transferase [Gemmatimonadota bacterium]|nr:sugar transferase [Gemmatimonadota bacterium]MDH5761173.1 sugar transferase [Gemmatimonadota bacterium]